MCSPLHLSRYATSSYQYGEAAFANLLTKRNKQCESWKSLHAKVSEQSKSSQCCSITARRINPSLRTSLQAQHLALLQQDKKRFIASLSRDSVCVRNGANTLQGHHKLWQHKQHLCDKFCPRTLHIVDDNSAIAGLTAKMSSQLYQASASKRTKAFGNPGAPYWFHLWQVSSQNVGSVGNKQSEYR